MGHVNCLFKIRSAENGKKTKDKSNDRKKRNRKTKETKIDKKNEAIRICVWKLNNVIIILDNNSQRSNAKKGNRECKQRQHQQQWQSFLAQSPNKLSCVTMELKQSICEMSWHNTIYFVCVFPILTQLCVFYTSHGTLDSRSTFPFTLFFFMKMKPKPKRLNIISSTRAFACLIHSSQLPLTIGSL